MRATRSYQQGLLASPAGQQAMATLAQLAHKRLEAENGGRLEEGLLSWETVSEFGKFRITVRCDYDVEQLLGPGAVNAEDPCRWQMD
jgi:hypothetical protein